MVRPASAVDTCKSRQAGLTLHGAIAHCCSHRPLLAYKVVTRVGYDLLRNGKAKRDSALYSLPISASSGRLYARMRRSTTRSRSKLQVKAIVICICAAWMSASARTTDQTAAHVGMAWNVQGKWTTSAAGQSIRAGDPISPGSLVQPAGLSDAHSLTVLLPDGQQLLYECFTPEDCSRGFRVPALMSQPSSFSLEMLARIRKGIQEEQAVSNKPEIADPPSHANKTRPAMDEAVVDWDGAAAVPVRGLVAALPDGRYTCALHPVHNAARRQDPLLLQKSGTTIMVPVPGAGLYDMVLSDAQGAQRVDMFVAVVDAKHSSLPASYKQARALLDSWNERFTGWPEHELLRAYLQAWFSGMP